ncbi:Unknown protein [Striga hermonthica]|uniref:F-box domain-containing protein n=1 Tax=Striga hermonthica TaxID=68872 RepID=A0A9N7R5B9_STRHE|nr:Unknown protein [Striga hermonthica]
MSDVPPQAMTDVPTQLPELLRPWSLPFDLAECVLIRLPVKTLKRFRGVEKSWRALIDSEKFAKAHLKQSLASNSNRNIISGVFGFQWMGLDSLDGARSIELECEYDKRGVHAVSNSINGLFVVTREPEPPILWNPFAREYKVLPKCPVDFSLESSCYCETTHGFGYDSENDDYKLVKVMWFGNRNVWLLSEEWIYSLKSNSWRRTVGTFYRGHWPTHFEGVLHTLVRTGWGPGLSDTKIMGFSIVSETEHEVAMPKADEKGLVHLKLDLFDGRLLALFCTYASTYASDAVVWVMEEYGVKESWVPLITMRIEKNGFIWPIAYTKDFDKILVNCSGRALVLFGVRRHSVQQIALPYGVWNKLCVETLISPQGWYKKDSREESSTKDHIEDGGNENNGKETMKKDNGVDVLVSGFKMLL